MKLAYLTNQYPSVSHSFIRREILALEARGLPVKRFSIRCMTGDLPDALDQREAACTECLLGHGKPVLAASLAQTAVTRPRAFATALRLTVQMGWYSQRGLARHFAYLAEACLLRTLCAAQGITHLHVHHATNPAAIALLCKTLGGPTYSLTVHGPEEFENVSRLALPLKLAGAGFVVAVSEYGRRELLRWCDAPTRAKIHIIHCGIDKLFSEEAHRSVPDVARFLWVGRLAEQKDPLLLVRAVAQLRAQNIPCAVTMIGDGPLRPAVENAIARCALGDAITLVGWGTGEGIRSQLDTSRALVLSSRAENIPSVLMEALAQRRPVISTNVGGISELVRDGENGWLVPPESPDALATAMCSALEMNVAQLNEMGRQGRQFVLEHFTVIRQAEALHDLLETLDNNS